MGKWAPKGPEGEPTPKRYPPVIALAAPQLIVPLVPPAGALPQGVRPAAQSRMKPPGLAAVLPGNRKKPRATLWPYQYGEPAGTTGVVSPGAVNGYIPP